MRLSHPATFTPAMLAGSSRALPHIRLAGGASAREGRLEAQLPDGRWGSVCEQDGYVVDQPPGSSRFPVESAAKVACAQLGFSGGVVRDAAFYGTGLSPVAADLRCSSTAPTLTACSFAGPELDRGQCGDGHIQVAVACAGMQQGHACPFVCLGCG